MQEIYFVFTTSGVIPLALHLAQHNGLFQVPVSPTVPYALLGVQKNTTFRISDQYASYRFTQT
jgi:hypothetical protein